MAAMNPKVDLQWNQAPTLLEWAEEELKKGKTEEVRILIKQLPEKSREKYRDLWVKYVKGKK